MGISVATCSLLLILMLTPVRSKVVKDEKELNEALEAVKPGDVIELQASKTYKGLFTATAKGESGKPIILRGPTSAILEGNKGVGTGYVLHLINAAYWKIEGFTIKNGQKGIMLDNSKFCVIDGVTVTHIGMEGVHFRRFSSDNVIKNSVITDTGVTKRGFGEGVYVGSSKNNWPTLTDGKIDRSDRNKILNNRIGPSLLGECIDIKEGTRDGEISGNDFDGSGLSNAHSDSSWIDLKGNGYYVSNNKGKNTLDNCIEVHVLLEGWGEGNVFDGNKLDASTAKDYGIYIQKLGSKPNIVYDNNKAPGAPKGLTNIKVTKKN